jgi:hypothetical protein
MKAVLVGSMGDRKLYYILDADYGDDDGAVVTSDGRVIMVNFFSLTTKTSGIKRVTNTPFHRFLWESPGGELKKIWMDTFIKKTRKLDKRFTESLITISQLGVKSKKNRETDRRVKSFLAEAEDKRKEYEKFSKLNTKQID